MRVSGFHIGFEKFFHEKRKESTLTRSVVACFFALLFFSVLNRIGLSALVKFDLWAFLGTFLIVSFVFLLNSGLFYLLASRNGGKCRLDQILYAYSFIIVLAAPLDFFSLVNGLIGMIYVLFLIYFGLTGLRITARTSLLNTISFLVFSQLVFAAIITLLFYGYIFSRLFLH